MRTLQKEIIISIVAVLVMTLAIIFFFKAMKTEKLNEKEDIYTLIDSDVNALLIVNRPGVVDRMILENQSFYAIFASEMPELFLSFVRRNQHIQSMVLSFHPQGVVCYVQADSRIVHSLEKRLQEENSTYSPIKQTKDGIDYYYYPCADNRFFGCYLYKGIWVGSFSRKLLENTVEKHQASKPSLPVEINRLIHSFDANAPINIVFPTDELDLRITQRNTTLWQIEEKWLGADLFISDGSLCCFGSLPFQPEIRSAMYKAMGDTISQRINTLYPTVSLTFQIDRAEDFIYYTGCTPIPDQP